MSYALFLYLGVWQVLFFSTYCQPKSVTGRSIKEYDCRLISRIEYDTDYAIIFCEDKRLWAQCPIE